MMSDLIDIQMLRALREAKGWDQQTLARHAVIDPSVVSRLERGMQHDLRASVLVALARALGVPVDLLLITPQQELPPEMARELSVVLPQLVHLSAAHQLQIAALLRAYLATIPG